MSPSPVPETCSRANSGRFRYLFDVPRDGVVVTGNGVVVTGNGYRVSGIGYRVSGIGSRYWGIYLGLGETQGGPPGWWSFPSPRDFLKRLGRLDYWHE